MIVPLHRIQPYKGLGPVRVQALMCTHRGGRRTPLAAAKVAGTGLGLQWQPKQQACGGCHRPSSEHEAHCLPAGAKLEPHRSLEALKVPQPGGRWPHLWRRGGGRHAGSPVRSAVCLPVIHAAVIWLRSIQPLH